MTRIHKAVSLLCLWVLCVGITGTINGTSHAQTLDNSPLYIVYGSDLYAYHQASGTLEVLIDGDDETNLGAVESPTLSPDGRYIVYRTPAPITVDAIQRVGGIGGGQLPDDLMLYDVASGNVTSLAVQAEDASLFTEGVPDNFLARSEPAWSPDGTQLAWSELVSGDSIRLVVGNIITGEITVISEDIPPQYGVPTAIPVYWGVEGIYVNSWEYVNEDVIQGFMLFGADGTLRHQFSLPQSEAFLGNLNLITHEGREFIATYVTRPVSFGRGLQNDSETSELTLIDPLTGAMQATTGYLEVYSTSAPDGASIVFIPEPNADNRTLFRAHFLDANGVYIDAPIVQSLTLATVSPDGTAFAHRPYNVDTRTSDRQVTLLVNGQTVPVPNPDDALIRSFIWGHTAFRINTTYNDVLGVPLQPVPTLSTSAFSCPGTITPRLTIGGQGIVLPGSPNRVRDSAGTTGTVIGEIPAGNTFTINDGPVCADGIVWWNVTFGDLTGWTAEGVEDTYFLEPIP